MTSTSLRDTNHLIVETVGGRWYIISSLGSRRDTQIITIERYTGHLLYTAQPGIDLFSTPRDALQFISKGKKILKSVTKCLAIIGYYIIGTNAYLVVATKASIDLILPPKHKVYTVQETQWLKISLGYPIDLSPVESKNADLMTEFPLSGLHFYCDTFDLTRPYPSTHAADDYVEEFCWNHFVTSEFRRIGLRGWCCTLLEGIALGKSVHSVESPNGVNVCILGRRSALNPGTRYLSRGLNSLASPGNEYEVEQIVWRMNEGTIQWSSVIWRRGTVPIHWKSEISSAVADAEIIISDKPFEKVDQYYKRLIDRYGDQPIYILNLLRSKQVHPTEGTLGEKYRESVELVKKLTGAHIEMLDYDWLHNLKHKQLDTAVEDLWKVTGSKIKDSGVTSGMLKITSTGKIVDVKIWKKQNGFLRVNCADSLDRTNLSTFFNGMHYLAEQCRQIGVSLCTGKNEFQDSWATLNYSLEKMRNTIDGDLLLKYAEMFLHMGDVCALLFTNTVAMHTSHIRDFATHLPSAPSNTKLIVERRIQNVLKDKARQAQYEMLLGLKWDKYFPSHIRSISKGKVNFLTYYPAYIFKSLPSEVTIKSTEEYLLLSQGSKHCWICPRDYDFVEVNIYLPTYVRLTELAITVRHGISESSSPCKMDVFIGTHIDNCQIVFQEMNIPKCEDAVKLLYEFPGQITGTGEHSALFPFDAERPSNTMRVARITFYGIPPGAFMTVGQIQLFGILASGKDPKEFYYELKHLSHHPKMSIAYDAVSGVEEVVDEPEAKPEKPATPMQEKMFDDDDVAADEPAPAVEKEKTEVKKVQPTTPASTTTTEPPTPTTTDAKPNTNKAIMSNYFDDQLASVLDAIPSKNRTSFTAEELAQQGANYLKFVKTKSPKTIMKITFKDALELELARMKLHIPSQMRDKILVENGYKVALFDPNRHVYRRDERIEKELAQKNKQTTKACTICAASLNFANKYSCRYCRNAFCKKCTSKEKKAILEYGWATPQQVCIECAESINKQERILVEIRDLVSKDEAAKNQQMDAHEKLFTQLYPPLSLPRKAFSEHEEETWLSEFPAAGILSSVSTDSKSPPVETVLFPTDILPDSYWFGPTGVHDARMIIMLPCYAVLSRMVLQVDQLGYHAYDLIDLRVSVAERLPQFHQQFDWKLTNKKIESMDQMVLKPGRQFEINVPPSDKKCARIIQVEAILRHKPEKKKALGNADTPASPSDQQPSVEAAKPEPFIHLGRLLIFGKVVVPPESTQLLSTNDQNMYDSIMKIKPKTTRVQLRTDVKFDGRSADLTILAATKLVSGFRIAVEHGSKGIRTQVKDIRVSLITQNEKNEIVSQHVIGLYTVPKVAAGTSLCFDFEKTWDNATVVRFEFLNNYGDEELSHGKVFLFQNSIV